MAGGNGGAGFDSPRSRDSFLILYLGLFAARFVRIARFFHTTRTMAVTIPEHIAARMARSIRTLASSGAVDRRDLRAVNALRLLKLDSARLGHAREKQTTTNKDNTL